MLEVSSLFRGIVSGFVHKSMGQDNASKLLRGKLKEPPDNGFGLSIRRVLDVLDILRRSERPLRSSEIFEQLSIPRSSGYEIIKILEASEYIERRGGGNAFSLGRQLHILGMIYREQVDLLKDGGPIVEALRERTGETVQLCILDNDYLLVLLKEDGLQPVRIISKVGTRVPVNWGASGRLLVSDLPDKQLVDFLTRTASPSPIDQRPVDIPALVKEIRTFRRRGWAFELNQTNEHAGCIAAPVLDLQGHCIATLSVVVPEQRLQKGQLQPLVSAVREAARQLSSKLGAS
jgi:DNA-binding IclR family transcriptional regulator